MWINTIIKPRHKKWPSNHNKGISQKMHIGKLPPTENDKEGFTDKKKFSPKWIDQPNSDIQIQSNPIMYIQNHTQQYTGNEYKSHSRQI